MQPVIAALQEEGYIIAKNLFATPYDCRVSADFLEKQTDFTQKMKDLIENTFAHNDNTPVILLAHSMGNLHIRRFLNGQSSQWRSKFVKFLFSMAAPWVGVPTTVKGLLSGDTIVKSWYTDFFKIFQRERVMKLMQTFGALVYMNPALGVWGDTPLVHFSQDNSTFSAKDLSKLYSLATKSKVLPGLRRLLEGILDDKAPGVNMTCMMGLAVPTERQWTYENFTSPALGWPKRSMCGDGDGTVTVDSHNMCRKWAKSSQGSISIGTYPGRSHSGILGDHTVLQDFIRTVRYINSL